MQRTALLIASIASRVLAAGVTWGPGLTVGPADTFIVQAETFLFPPKVPNMGSDTLLIWSGHTSDMKDRYQQVLGKHTNGKGPCNARADQWCVYDRSFTQVSKAMAVTNAEMANGIAMRMQHDINTGKTTQTIWTTTYPPKLLGSLENAHGRPKTWQTAIECNGRCSRIEIGSHQWVNTTLWLSAPDPSFGSKVKQHQVWANQQLDSFEGGKVWQLPSVVIPPVRIGTGSWSIF